MTLSTALSALVATELGVELSAVSVGVNNKGEIVARVKGLPHLLQWVKSARVQCFLEPVPDDYDPIAAGDGEWSSFPP